MGAFELSQCADCERPALSSVPPTVKAVAAKQSAAFLKSARSDKARSRDERVAGACSLSHESLKGGALIRRITAMGELQALAPAGSDGKVPKNAALVKPEKEKAAQLGGQVLGGR